MKISNLAETSLAWFYPRNLVMVWTAVRQNSSSTILFVKRPGFGYDLGPAGRSCGSRGPNLGLSQRDALGRLLVKIATVGVDIKRGLEMVLRAKKLGIAVSFLHTQPNQATSSEEAALQKKVY